MWETTDDAADAAEPLTHEMPCVRCGHPPHLFLPCGDDCECEPEGMPGERLTG